MMKPTPLRRSRLALAIAAAAVVAMAACSGGEEPPPPTAMPPAQVISFQVTSSAFAEGDTIPARYTCDGEDVSPSLDWSGLPDGTRSVALIADYPDAPRGTWVHWVAYNLPADSGGLPEGVPGATLVALGGTQGTNDFGGAEYGGPCPPGGDPHRYFFKVYALDTAVSLEEGARKADLLETMQGHILAQGQLMGSYQRQR